MTKRKQKWAAGDVVDIAVGLNQHAFGRVLLKPLMAFYDLLVSEVPSVEVIVTKPVLFRVWVMNYAVTHGDWPIIGHLELTSELLEPPPFFKQDHISGRLKIYLGQGQERSATREQVEGLERAAVWEPGHIVDRLRDHFAGKSNIWVESLKPR